MATTAEKLAEARDALHDWQTGRGVVEVRDASGDVLRYSPVNLTRLIAYIAELETALGQTPAKPVTRPMRLTWG